MIVHCMLKPLARDAQGRMKEAECVRIGRSIVAESHQSRYEAGTCRVVHQKQNMGASYVDFALVELYVYTS